ncbi:MAG: TIGR00374 family protein, partial [Thermobifida sp.]|nr:TIGR00374 family protein [Thermobifida sp.]
MRKRKDSHDGSPVGDTNILFVPDSSADPSASGVDALMGMIDEAEASAPEATTETDVEASTGDKDADIESAASPATGEIAANLPVRRMRLPRPVYIADRILPVRRRREDLVDVVISLIAILFIWTIGALASATTRGVTMD